MDMDYIAAENQVKHKGTKMKLTLEIKIKKMRLNIPKLKQISVFHLTKISILVSFLNYIKKQYSWFNILHFKLR